MTETTKNISSFITREEIRVLSRPNDLRAFGGLLINWGIIASAFAMAILWTNPLTILVAILLIGGRQLGLGVLLHDCAHHSYFSKKTWNQFAGHWLCGAPVNIALSDYREYHLRHHRHAGTDDDPDRGFVINYPVEKSSLKRKLKRDLTGQTGIRDTLYKLKTFKLSKNYPWLFFHILMISVLTLAGSPWAYFLWIAAEIFVYPLLARVRQIGEHGVARNRDNLEPRENTSTTIASFWERLIFAPNCVNFHLEHHQFAAVPPYRLAALHKLLNERGYHDGFDCISYGYADVLRRAVRS